MVLPVITKAPEVKVALGLNVPAIPIVPPLTSVTLFVVRAPLIVRLLKLNAGTLCAPVPLKSIVLPVMVWPVAMPPVLKVPAMPIVPLEASTLVKALKVRLP